MRITILILLSFFATLPLFGQHDSVLKTFKYRINHYQAISFGISGGTQLYDWKLGLGTFKNNGASGYFGANYFSVKSTDRNMLTVSAGVSPGYSWSKAEDPTNKSTGKSFNASYSLSALNRWFRGKLFMEAGADLSGSYYSNKVVSNNSSAMAKNIRDDYSAALHLGFGKGRLENITDMQNALWLYRALQAEKRLSRSLTDDELNELGRTITRANNTRVLDTRKRTQFILETTDQFFRKSNALTDDDIRYFSTLNDVLFFAINNPRLSGTELFLRLTPAISEGNRKDVNIPAGADSKSGGTDKSVMLSAGVSRYLPAGLRHQNNYGIALQLKYASDDLRLHFIPPAPGSDFDANTLMRQAGLNLSFQHAIYPNTRTIAAFNFSAETGYEQIESRSSLFGLADVSASLDYFISYRTKFVCNIGSRYQKNIYALNYNHELESLPDSFQFYANVSLQVNL